MHCRKRTGWFRHSSTSFRPTSSDSPPRLLVAASKDAPGVNLDRVQIIKGWVDPDGTQRPAITRRRPVDHPGEGLELADLVQTVGKSGRRLGGEVRYDEVTASCIAVVCLRVAPIPPFPCEVAKCKYAVAFC